MGNAGAQAIGTYLLKYPKAVEVVRLSENYIQKKGAIELGENKK